MHSILRELFWINVIIFIKIATNFYWTGYDIVQKQNQNDIFYHKTTENVCKKLLKKAIFRLEFSVVEK